MNFRVRISAEAEMDLTSIIDFILVRESFDRAVLHLRTMNAPVLVMLLSLSVACGSNRTEPLKPRAVAVEDTRPNAVDQVQHRSDSFQDRRRPADKVVLTVGRTCICGTTEYTIHGEAVGKLLDAIEFAEVMAGIVDQYPDIEFIFYRGQEVLATTMLLDKSFIRLSDTDVTLTPASIVKLEAWFEDNQIPLQADTRECIGDPCADSSVDQCAP